MPRKLSNGVETFGKEFHLVYALNDNDDARSLRTKQLSPYIHWQDWSGEDHYIRITDSFRERTCFRATFMPDYQGHIWIWGFRGVYRFDGTAVHKVTLKKASVRRLTVSPSRAARTIDGLMLLRTNVGLFAFRNGRPFEADYLLPYLAPEIVKDVAEDPTDGSAWLLTSKSLVHVKGGAAGKVALSPVMRGDFGEGSLALTPDGTVWMSEFGGLLAWDPRARRLVRVIGQSSRPSMDADGGVLVRSDGQVLKVRRRSSPAVVD